MKKAPKEDQTTNYTQEITHTQQVKPSLHFKFCSKM